MLFSHETSFNEKWEKLSQFLKANGAEGYAYATLQPGLACYATDVGYLAYIKLPRTPLCWREHVLVFSNPVCPAEHWGQIVTDFQKIHTRITFAIISEPFALVLRDLGYRVSWAGYEPVLPIQTYPVKGDWKEYDLIRRAQNEVKRHKLALIEVDGNLKPEPFLALNERWLLTKHSTGKEAWLYARTPVYEAEPDVRRFIAKTPDGDLVGYAFYDPIYQNGMVIGYAANIIRTDENRFAKLVPALHMMALEKFKAEGLTVLNLLIVPFNGRQNSMFNDCRHSAWLGDLILKYGNQLYNFAGKARHKDKYRGVAKPMYVATNGFSALHDVSASLHVAHLI